MTDKDKKQSTHKVVYRNDNFDWTIPVPKDVAKKNKLKAKKEEIKDDLKDN